MDMKTKYRGTNIYIMPTSADVADCLSHGSNLIRYQILVLSRSTGEVWKNEVRAYLDNFDTQVAPNFTNGQRAILDIHWTPGIEVDFWGSACLQDTFFEMWAEIAARYKNNGNVYAYGILNEPNSTTPNINKLMNKACEVIRKIDSRKMIIVTGKVSSPDSFKQMKKSSFKNIYYEVHMYKPMSFTHQGYYGNPIGPTYPNKSFNKEILKRWLMHVRNFQVNNNAQILVGEFSASPFTEAKSRNSYLYDLINIFESYGWQWTFFCWEPSDSPSKPWDINATAGTMDMLTTAWNKK